MINEIQNSQILTQVLQTRVNKAMREKYPTAEDVLTQVIKEQKPIFK
jgi:hypothetical protein